MRNGPPASGVCLVSGVKPVRAAERPATDRTSEGNVRICRGDRPDRCRGRDARQAAGLIVTLLVEAATRVLMPT